MSETGSVIVRVGADLGPLRAGLNQAHAAAQQFNSTTTQALGKVQTSAQGVATATTQAANAMRQSSQATAAAGRAATQSLAQTGTAARLTSHELTNLSFQLNDIASGLASGQSPLRILAQQGGQVFQVFQRAGLAASIAHIGEIISKTFTRASAAVMAFIATPMGIAATAAVAAIAAIGGIFAIISSRLPTVDRAIERHDAAIDSIAESWKRAAAGSEEYRSRASEAIQFAANQDLRTQKSLLDRQLRGALGMGALTGGGLIAEMQQERMLAQVQIGITPQQRARKEFLPAIKEFLDAAKTGAPDVERLNAEIQRIANIDPSNVALQKVAERLLNVSREATDTVQRMREVNQELTKLRINQAFDAAGQQTEAFGTSAQQRRMNADLAGIGARSPAELAEAARRREEATPFAQGESLAQRRFRIEAAATQARAQAENQLSEALDQRAASMQRTVAAAQTELDLIGETTAQIERQNLEFSLLQAAKEAAARSNTEVSEEEIRSIRAVAAEYGRLQEQIEAARVLEGLLFERSQMGRTAIEREVASTLRNAGLDPGSATGQAIAQNVRFNEQLSLTVDRLDEVRAGARDALSGFVADLRRGVTLADAFRNALARLGEKLLDLGLSMLTEGLFGQKGQGGGGLFGGALMGGMGGNRAAGGQIASMMGNIFGANDNASQGLGGGGVAQQIARYFTAKGLQPHQVAAIVGTAQAESGFNPHARGAAGEAGLFQHLGPRLTGLMGATGGNLGNVRGQLDHVWNEFQGPERGSFNMLRGSRDVLGATRAMTAFERPAGFSMGNIEGAHNFTGRLANSQAALLKYSDTMTETAQTFTGQFDSTLGDMTSNMTQSATGFTGGFRSALQNVVGGMGGAGSKGAGGFLSKLFGGGGNALSAAAIAATSGGAGLFAMGGIATRPSIISERGQPEAAVPLPDGRTIPVTLRASPDMMSELRSDRAQAPKASTNVTIQGSTIVIQGSVDQKTMAELERRLDERDGQLKNNLQRGEIASIQSRYGSLRG